MSYRFPVMPSRAHLRDAQARYHGGGVLTYATESCFGLGCDPFSAKGLRQILAIKGRPNHKGMIVVAASLAQLKPLLAPLSAEDEQRLRQFWPGPITLLLPASPKVLPLLRGRHRQIAVRVTAHPDTAALCRVLGPLVSTSANPAGQRSLTQYRACLRLFSRRTMVLKGRTGRARRPSTIIDFASGRVLR